MLSSLAVAVAAALSTSCAAAEKSDVDDHRGEFVLVDIDDGVYAAANCADESSTVAWRRRRAIVMLNMYENVCVAWLPRKQAILRR
mmetsp:Transcript_18741/g.30758  ORF Transcript_18741/g.30758 Transcript_18741/m.30758 type:complete len:86 (+) Transcript_18741:82-339(+)